MANNRTQVTSVSENYLPHLKFAKQHKAPVDRKFSYVLGGEHNYTF